MRYMALVALVVVLCAGYVPCASALGQPPDAWASGRRIYQLLTDRFARPSTDTTPCNMERYCGGNFQGIADHLDYIVGMGFNAIWISPVPVNFPEGYHGYWAIDFTRINPHFGTKAELKQFVDMAHARGVWVMIDIVLNHVGPVNNDFSSVVPFSNASCYHPECQVTQYTCESPETLHCRLANLPDLDQSNPQVGPFLKAWTANLLSEFGFDGIRADTVMYINNDFWAEVSAAVKGAYMVGEVYSSMGCNIAYTDNGIDATLNYPYYFALRSVYQQGASMYDLGTAWREQLKFSQPNWEVNFLDNHDNDRFMNASGASAAVYRGALAHMFFSQGIPCIYYGTEQMYSGGINGNYCREPLWTSGYNTQTPMYKFFTALSAAHETFKTSTASYQEYWRDDAMYCFRRGAVFVCSTNQATGTIQRTVPNIPFVASVMCSVFNVTDCSTWTRTMTLSLTNGEPKVWFERSQGIPHLPITYHTKRV